MPEINPIHTHPTFLLSSNRESFGQQTALVHFGSGFKYRYSSSAIIMSWLDAPYDRFGDFATY